MNPTFEKYKDDLKRLTHKGKTLHLLMRLECDPEISEDSPKKTKEIKEFLEKEPSFEESYQAWYSEAKILIKQLLPDRLDDFISHYKKPKPRKDITYENYRIEDYLQGLIKTKKDPITGLQITIVKRDGALPHFRQQLAILKSVKSRFESSLFDIKQLVQADIFDSELDQSRELLKKGFLRGAGAIVGVVLEKHLADVCKAHNIASKKKHPTISEFNDLLKSGEILDIPAWRQIQRLGDLRNLCDHGKGREPSKEEIEELISGTDRIIHNIF